MKLLIFATGKNEECPDVFGARLIEQGKAVLPPAVKADAGTMPEAKPEKEEKKTKKG